MIAADVYRNGALVGHFTKTGQGVVEFEYLKSAEFPIATSLPLDGGPYVGAAGALPPQHQRQDLHRLLSRDRVAA